MLVRNAAIFTLINPSQLLVAVVLVMDAVSIVKVMPINVENLSPLPPALTSNNTPCH